MSPVDLLASRLMAKNRAPSLVNWLFSRWSCPRVEFSLRPSYRYSQVLSFSLLKPNLRVRTLQLLFKASPRNLMPKSVKAFVLRSTLVTVPLCLRASEITSRPWSVRLA